MLCLVILSLLLSTLGFLKFIVTTLPPDIKKELKKLAIKNIRNLHSNQRRERCLNIDFGVEETNSKSKKSKKVFLQNQ